MYLNSKIAARVMAWQGLLKASISTSCLLVVLMLSGDMVAQNVSNESRTILLKSASSSSDLTIDPEVEKMLHYYNEKIYFVENKGQLEKPILFNARFKLGSASVMEDGVLMRTYLPEDLSARSEQSMRQEIAQAEGRPFTEEIITIRSHAWKMKFVNHLASMKIETSGKHNDKFNYFKGNVHATDVASYQEIWYNNVYNNVDVRYYPAVDGSLEYDIVCKKGFNPKDLMIQLEGISKMIVNEAGSLVLTTSVGEMSLPSPVVYQMINGQKEYVNATYKIVGSDTYTFELGKFNPEFPLLIDPIALRWATWINSNSSAWGSNTDGHNHGHGIYIDPTDGAIITVARVDGQTNNITVGALETSPNGGIDLIVGRYYEPTTVGGAGVRDWQTYIGGSSDDNPYALEMDANGNIYITGQTQSTDFPLTAGSAYGNTGGLDARAQASDNIFVLKLNNTGNSLKAAVIGGNYSDNSYDLRVSTTGDVYICGVTSSRNLSSQYPASGAVNRANGNQNQDLFVFKINSNLTSIGWMKNYGGTGNDIAHIMLTNESTGDIYLGGVTSSSSFPTLNPRQNSRGGDTAGFLSKLKSVNGTIAWASYFSSASSKDAKILCMEFNQQKDAIYFGGVTDGLDNTNLLGGYDLSLNGSNDFFVAKMDTAQTLLASTYIGGSNNEVNMMGLNVDDNNDVYIFGYSNSANFPITSDALQSQLNNSGSNGSDPNNDKVFLKMTSTLASSPIYSTYYGGSGDDYDPVGERGIKFSNCRIYTIVTAKSNNIPLTTGAVTTTKTSSTSIYEPGLVVWSNPPDMINNEIYGNQVICAGIQPSQLTGTVPSYVLPNISRNGTSTTYPNVISASVTYTWQRSTDGNTWTNIAGGNQQNLAGNLIGILNETTYFRRIISGDACVLPDAANQTVTVTVINSNGEVNNITCHGANNGSIVLNPTGVAPFNYSWNHGPSSSSLSNLSAGTYTVTVSDANGCTSTDSYTIVEPAVLSANITTVSTLCEANNGYASVTVSGGTAPYSYLWSNNETSSFVSGLDAGAISVLVTDANGCSIQDFDAVQTTSALTISLVSKTNVDCSSDFDGVISVSAASGVNPYMFSLNGGTAQSNGTFNNVGAGNYIVTVTDGNGCVDAIEVSISAIDSTDPYFTYIPDDASYSCDAAIPNENATASDLYSSNVTVTFEDETVAGSCPGELVITRTFTATDDCGNNATAQQIITVYDTESPWFTYVPATETINCNDVVPFVNASASDKCSDVTVTHEDEIQNQSCPGTYDIVRTFTATDLCGNSENATQIIHVKDEVAPVLNGTPAAELNVTCYSEVPAAAIVTASDNCGGIIVVDFQESETNLGTSCNNTITRTWSAMDNCGNDVSFTQTINVNDEVAPVLDGTPAAELNVTCYSEVPAAANVTASDNCGGIIVVDFQESETNLGTSCNNTITRTWSAMDNCGNDVSFTQTINVNDEVAPVLDGTPAAELNVTCYSEVPAAANVTASDNCGGIIVVDFQESETNLGTSCNNTITRTWSAMDNCGNDVSFTQTINVNDEVAPVLNGTPAAELNVTCYSEVPAAANVTASDNCGGIIVVDFQESETNLGTSCNNTITRTWSAMDNCGNDVSFTQTINVNDEVAPELNGTPAAELNVTCYSEVPAAAIVTASDNCGGIIVVDFQESETNLGSSCNNTITRTWSAMDNCGNDVSFTQTINVNDEVAPVLNGTPAAELNVTCYSEVPAAANVTASDNCGGIIVVDFQESETNLGTSCNNTITRTWSAMDNCGNDVSFTQTITVNDDVAPEISEAGSNITINCPATPIFTAPTATDNCNNTPFIEVVSDETIPGDCAGTYTRTMSWKAVDLCGNESDIVSQTISVVDETAPVLLDTPIASLTVTSESQIPTVAIVFAFDECDTDIQVDFEESTEYNTCGYVITRLWTAADDCGNDVSFTQTISVVDESAPTLEGVPADIETECDAIPTPAVVTASDDFSDNLDVEFTETTQELACGSIITRTWSTEDACGNPVSDSQMIYVVDTTTPELHNLPATDVFVTCYNDVPAPAMVTVTDNCDDSIELVYTENETELGSSCNNTITRTWSAIDNCGNDVSFTQTINVLDEVAPILNNLPSVSEVWVTCYSEVEEAPEVTATDNCGGTIQVNYSEIQSELGSSCNNLIVRQWNAEDNCGNGVGFTQIIHVLDEVAPVLNNLPSVSEVWVTCYNEVEEAPEVTATDNCGGTIQVNYSETQSELGSSCNNLIVRQWNAEDNCGNGVGFTQVIHVLDEVAPVLNNLPSVSEVWVTCYSEVEEAPEVTATDNCGGTIQVNYSETQSELGSSCNNLIVRQWNAEDNCGNGVGFTQIIHVLDEVAPVLNNLPSVSEVWGTCYSEVEEAPEVTATDNCGGTIQVNYSETQSELGSSCNNLIVRQWNAEDNCGNGVGFTQIIHVNDEVAPVLNGTPASTVTVTSVEEIPSIATVSATDNCGGNILVDFEENEESNDCGLVITRTWSAMDNCGNDVAFTQTITVVDENAPILYGVPADETVECDAIPAPANVTASDNFTENLDVIFTADTTLLECGQIIVRTWSVTDLCGNAVSDSQTLTVVDTQDPTLVGLPESSQVFVDCYNDVPSAPVVTVNDNCDNDIQVVFEESEITEGSSCNNVITRSWYAEDNCGNSTSFVQFIFVNDEVAPVLYGVPSNIEAECSALPEVANVYAVDACQGNIDVIYNEEGTQEGCYYNLVRTWTAVDACGNVATASQTIVVGDNTAPETTSAPAEEIWVECDETVPTLEVTFSDNCDTDLNIESISAIAIVDCGNDISRSTTATDECGNSTTFSQIVHIRDTTSPSIVWSNADQTIECTDEVPAAIEAQFADNCDEELSIVANENTIELECGYQIQRTWTATDDCGNATVATQNIFVTDTQAPVIGNYTYYVGMECDEVDNYIGITATDNCGDVTITFVDQLNSGGCLGTIVRTYTVSDACGNTASAEQYISIHDTHGPVINNPANATVECTEAPTSIPSIEIYDACGFPVEILEASQEIVEIDACYYQIVWHWSAIDYCENVSEATTVITVTDLTSPSFSSIAEEATFSCDQEYVAPSAPIASDNCDTTLEVVPNVETIAGACPQSYDLVYTWTAYDNCGNFAIAQTIHHIVDETSPVFANNTSEFYFECDEEVSLVQPNATDNCGEVTYSHVDGESWTEGCTIGFVRIWTATDECGNASEFNQYIYIQDTTAPVIVGTIEIDAPCDNYQQNFVTATDNCHDFDITYEDMAVSGSCAGRYVRTYTATDDCGNASTFVQIINLVDTTAPTAVNPIENLTIECGETYPAYEAIFTDNCSEEIFVTDSTSTVSDGDGCTTIITESWTATDLCGNSTTVSRTITITDTVNPYFLDIPADMTISCEAEFSAPSLPMGYDSCDDNVEVTVTEQITPGACPNTYDVQYIWRAFDNCGNSSMAITTYHIVDQVAPVWNYETAVSELSFECDEVVASIQPTATDNCNVVEYMVAETLFVSGPCYTSGAYIFTAVDACGNASAPFYQYFTIVDTTAPVVAPYDVEVDMPCDQVNGNALISATDNCNEVTITFVDTYVSGGCQGRIIRDYTITDACQNTSYAQQIITLIDVVDPIAEVLPENLTIECGSEVPGFIPTWSDNCDDELELSAISSIAIDGCNQIISRSWTAVDNCGNATTISQMITIVDTTAPEFEYVPADYTAECSSELSFEMAYAWDICDENVTVEVAEQTNQGNCAGNYTIVRTFTATDACGNSNVATQTITVVDTTAPEFTFVPANATVTCGDYNGFMMATATDLCSGVEVTFVETSAPFFQEGTNGDCGQFTTFSVGGWGAPNGTAANYRDENFASAFPNGLTVGCGNNTYSFTSAQAIENFLPAGGPSSTISGNTVNPTGVQNQLANQLVAAVLSVGFDANDANFAASSNSLGSAVYNNGPFSGMTVSQVITLGNQALGGCSSTYTLGSLAEALATLNLNYDGEGVDNGNFDCGTTESICGTEYTRVWTATDGCGNTAIATTSIVVYDNVAPTFNGSVSNVTIQCASEIPAFVELTATDACGTATVTRTEEVLSSDDCGNQVIEVSYAAVDNCGNAAYTSYTITVNDNVEPTLEGCPADVAIACDGELPAVANVTAFDNCDSDVSIAFEEFIIGDAPAEGSIADCNLITPALPAGNPCGYSTPWAMAMFNLPSAHKYYTVQNGNLVQYPNGTVHLTAEMHNAATPANGWNVNVWFNNQKTWTEWSSQNFPTGFKADCGGEGANHQDWLYFILQAGDGAEMTGFGGYTGSSVNLTHAPSSNYFGFQLGDGANNYNGADNGFGGWFTYNGYLQINGTPYGNNNGNISGGGDFAFELDCCPDYTVVRQWTATDCSGNVSTCVQNITFDGTTTPTAPGVTVEPVKEEIASVGITPNPAVDQVNFKFKASLTANATIEVYDMTGNILGTVYNGKVVYGTEYTTSFDVSRLPNGIYFVKYTNGLKTTTEKLIVAK